MLWSSPASATNWCNDADTAGCWLFDESSGDAIDSSSNGNDGTVTGVTYGATGQFGDAYDFDSDGDNVNFGSAASLDDLEPFTFCMWYQVDTEAFGDGWIGKNFSSSGRWSITINSTSTNRLLFLKETSDPDLSEQVENAYNPNGTTWTHMCISYDGDNGADNDDVIFTIDGSKQDISSSTRGNSKTDASNSLIASNNFDGRQDELLYIGRVLDNTDINDIMTNGLVQAAAARRVVFID